jgi:hypothetical protein
MTLADKRRARTLERLACLLLFGFLAAQCPARDSIPVHPDTSAIRG